MPLFFLYFLSLLFCCSIPCTASQVCTSSHFMQHSLVSIPGAVGVPVQVPLDLHYPCKITTSHTAKYPLVIILQGALLRGRDYSTLATFLADIGYVVATPDYFLRVTDYWPAYEQLQVFINQTIEMGFDCPLNGSIPSARLVQSIIEFFLDETTGPKNVKQAADLRKTTLFGHSGGGRSILDIFSGRCDVVSEPQPGPPRARDLYLRFICEQYQDVTSRKVKLPLGVMFDGYNEVTPIEVPPSKFLVSLTNPFRTERSDRVFKGPFSKNVATAVIKKSNHFGCNNFVKENDAQIPVCNSAFPPSTFPQFSTDEKTQTAVIQTIAEATHIAVLAVVEGKGKRFLRRRMKRLELVTRYRLR